jgi:hypothetical protein
LLVGIRFRITGCSVYVNNIYLWRIFRSYDQRAEEKRSRDRKREREREREREGGKSIFGAYLRSEFRESAIQFALLRTAHPLPAFPRRASRRIFASIYRRAKRFVVSAPNYIIPRTNSLKFSSPPSRSQPLSFARFRGALLANRLSPRFLARFRVSRCHRSKVIARSNLGESSHVTA